MRHFTIALCLLISFSIQNVLGQCIPEKPKKLKLKNETGCEATLSWKMVPDVAFYKVKYKEPGGTWVKLNVKIPDTFFTFTGLLPNLQYTFAVASFCTQASGSDYAKLTQTGSPCSPPLSVSATQAGSKSVTISWTNCGSSDNNQVRYRKINKTAWNYVTTGPVTNTTLDFSTTTPIIYEVTGCTLTEGNWSEPDTFYFATSVDKKPNAIVVLLDDSRYDVYGVNGAPSFFKTPNIDRIANEGVNFKKSFCVYSLCNPSRASIFTGLYASNNGAFDNTEMFYDYLPTISKVMNEQGYYTAFMGKYMNANDDNPVPQPGWDWWMARVKSGHMNANFNYNGNVKKMNGHVTDVLTDSTIALINRVEEPFLIYIAYSATHGPYKPRPEDDHLFDDEVMPIPDNYYPYVENVPSNLLEPNVAAPDTATLIDDYTGIFEMMEGIEVSMGKILEALEDKNILDSTLVLFTSDNGYLLGEHFLEGKRLPQDPSTRVPMFIRYPKWFPEGSIVNDRMALNIDIAPTLFDLAEAPDTFNVDGLSMHRLFDDEVDRTAYMYQATHLNDSAVNTRSVRTLSYKYTYYYCDKVTEEFFDLANDPDENVNLINDSGHQVLIQKYRQKLDSFKTALGDDIVEDISTCKLKNPHITRFGDDEDYTELTLKLYPNPASSTFHFKLPDAGDGAIVGLTIYDMKAQPVFRQEGITIDEGAATLVSLPVLADGLYDVQVRLGDEIVSKKLLIVK